MGSPSEDCARNKKRKSMTAFWELCRDGQIEQVRAEIARGGDVNDKDSYGITALMYAVWKGHNSIVKLLLEQPRVKTNEKNMWGSTALHDAANYNNPEAARMLLLHPGFNSANSTDNYGRTALMKAVSERKKEVVLELVKHESVSLDLREDYLRNADLRLIIEEAKTRRAQVSNQAVNIQGGASRLSRALNQATNSQSGASRLSRELESSLRLSNDDDSVSQCKERCKQELEELRKHQTERVELLLQRQEEKEQQMKLENRKKERELKKEFREKEGVMKKEIREKEEVMKTENEKALSLLLEENESQEALMVAKHEEEERAARKEAELETERNSKLSPSEPTQPLVPECPVC